MESLNLKNGNNNKILHANFNAENNSNLSCIEVDNESYSSLHWSYVDNTTSFSVDCSGTHTDDTYIQDSNFEQALINLGLDTELDHYVVTASISEIETLDISNNSIKELQGIKAFTALKNLDCSNNNLDELNLESNLELQVLDCSNNNLMNLFLGNHIKLTSLNCSSNNLFELNIKNGNNNNFIAFNSVSNDDLVCIEIDDKSYSDSNWLNIDVQMNFNENCGSYKKLDSTYILDIGC